LTRETGRANDDRPGIPPQCASASSRPLGPDLSTEFSATLDEPVSGRVSQGGKRCVGGTASGGRPNRDLFTLADLSKIGA